MAIGGGFNDHGGGKSYPGEFTKAALWTSIAAACGGLIFGYDIGISGGVTSMPIFLEKFFPSVYHNQVLHDNNTNQYCKFNDQRLTIFTSSLYFAAIVSSCVASYVTRRWGRKPSMLAGGFFFLFGALINGFAQNLAMLYIGRALLGFGIGFANQSAPVYLSEMAPYKHRGACNMLFQLSITIGILAANLINFGTSYLGSIGWRISLGGAAVPALIFVACTSWLPDSPNSLIERGKEDEAKEMLIKIRGTKDVDQEFNDLVAASNESKKITHPWRDLLTKRKHIPHLTLVTCIPAFQQLTGMNVIMFYAPVLFKTIGFGNVASLGSSVVTGLVNALATLVSIKTVDRLGRRHWFLEGGIQMFICQVIITLCIALKFGLNGDPGTLPLWYGAIVVIAICVYVAGFAWSWGPLGWLVPCEVLPLEIRSAGQTVNVLVNMLFTFLIAECFLQMMCAMKFGLFIFFAFFVVMMTVFIYYLCPETKGIPIEDMQDIFKNHPVWKNYVEQDDSSDKKLPPV